MGPWRLPETKDSIALEADQGAFTLGMRRVARAETRSILSSDELPGDLIIHPGEKPAVWADEGIFVEYLYTPEMSLKRPRLKITDARTMEFQEFELDENPAGIFKKPTGPIKTIYLRNAAIRIHFQLQYAYDFYVRVAVGAVRKQYADLEEFSTRFKIPQMGEMRYFEAPTSIQQIVEKELPVAMKTLQDLVRYRDLMDRNGREKSPLVIWQIMRLGEMYPFFTDELKDRLGIQEINFETLQRWVAEGAVPSDAVDANYILLKFHVGSAQSDHKSRKELMAGLGYLTPRLKSPLVIIDHSPKGMSGAQNYFNNSAWASAGQPYWETVAPEPLYQHSSGEDFANHLKSRDSFLVVYNPARQRGSWMDGMPFMAYPNTGDTNLEDDFVAIGGKDRSVTSAAREVFAEATNRYIEDHLGFTGIRLKGWSLLTEVRRKILKEVSVWEERIFLDGEVRENVNAEVLEQGRYFFEQMDPRDWRGKEFSDFRKKLRTQIRTIVQAQIKKSNVQPESIRVIAHDLNNFLVVMGFLELLGDEIPASLRSRAEVLTVYLNKRVRDAANVMRHPETGVPRDESADLTRKTTELLIDINRLLTGGEFRKSLEELKLISATNISDLSRTALRNFEETASEAAEFARLWLGFEKPKISEVDLSAALWGSLKAHSALSVVGEVRLDSREEYKIQTYKVYLMEALLNFLKDSAESLPLAAERPLKKGDVLLTARKLDSGRFEIVVDDKGSGISQEHLEELQHDHSFTTKTNGHGIGMLRSINLIRGPLQGTFHIESKEGTGTKITITLPPTLSPSSEENAGSDQARSESRGEEDSETETELRELLKSAVELEVSQELIQAFSLPAGTSFHSQVDAHTQPDTTAVLDGNPIRSEVRRREFENLEAGRDAEGEAKKRRKEVKPRLNLGRVYREIQKLDAENRVILKNDLLRTFPSIKESAMGNYIETLEALELITVDRSGPTAGGHPIQIARREIGGSFDQAELEFLLSEYATKFDLGILKAQVAKVLGGTTLFPQGLPLPQTLDYRPALDEKRERNSQAKNSVIRITFEWLDLYFPSVWIKETSYMALTSGLLPSKMSSTFRTLGNLGLVESRRSAVKSQTPWIRLVKMTRTQRDEILKILRRVETEITQQQASAEIKKVFAAAKAAETAAPEVHFTKAGRNFLFPDSTGLPESGRMKVDLEGVMKAIWALEAEGNTATPAAIRGKLPGIVRGNFLSEFSGKSDLDFRVLGVKQLPMSSDKQKFLKALENAAERLRFGTKDQAFSKFPLTQNDLAQALGIQLRKMMAGVRRHKIDLDDLGVFPDLYNNNALEEKFSEKRREWTRSYLKSVGLEASSLNENYVMELPEAWKLVDSVVLVAVALNREQWKETKQERLEDFRNAYIRKVIEEAQEAYSAGLLNGADGQTVRILRYRLKQLAPGHRLLSESSEVNKKKIRAPLIGGDAVRPEYGKGKGTPEEIQKIMKELDAFFESRNRATDGYVKVLRKDGVLIPIGGIYKADSRGKSDIKFKIQKLLREGLAAPFAWAIKGNVFFIWSAEFTAPAEISKATDPNAPAELLGKKAHPFAKAINSPKREKRSEARSLAVSIAKDLIHQSIQADVDHFSGEIFRLKADGFSIKDFAALLEEAGRQVLAEKDQAMLKTALGWMNEVLEREGATAAAFDVPASEKTVLEAMLSYIEGKGRGQFAALLPQGLGEVASGGILTQRVNLDRYRPLYSIRGIQIQNADRVARIHSQEKSKETPPSSKANPNLFSVSGQGASAGMNTTLQRILELVASTMVGTVTAHQIDSTQDLQTSPRDVEEKVLAALLKGDYADLIPQGAGLLEIMADGSVRVNIPIFAHLLQQIHARRELDQAA